MSEVITKNDLAKILSRIPLLKSSLTNLVDGNAVGSVRGVRTFSENSSYTMGQYAFAEGTSTKASGTNSHAEGDSTEAKGAGSHAEGFVTVASGSNSHAEGNSTYAVGHASHAEGFDTLAEGHASHVEGYDTRTIGNYSHAGGIGTIAAQEKQTVIGKYNIRDTETDVVKQKALIIGNGTSDSARSNGFTVDWSGNVEFAGKATGNKGELAALSDIDFKFLGVNMPGTPDTKDTREFWQNLGSGYVYISSLDMVRGQVSQWGWIINLVYGTEVQQIWLSQSQQHVLKRTANASVTLMPDYWNPVGENISASQTLTLGNGTYSKTFYFNRTGNTIFLDSWMDIGDLATGSTTIGTLNANLRPKYEVRLRPGNSPAPYNTFFTIQTNGTVSIYTSTAITGPANYALHTSYLASNAYN